MSIAMCALGSGSKGNAVLVKNENTHLLIDCGLTLKQLTTRMDIIGVSPSQISGVVITHEHIDHIKGVAELSNAYGTPIYAPEKTMRLIKTKCAPKLTCDINAIPLKAYDAFAINDINILPFRNPHDAVCPVGYAFTDSNSKALYATDLGAVTTDLVANADGAELIMLESNYDFDMLITGKYPQFLKQRILSVKGHLSNADCAKAITQFHKMGTRKFILGHISEENNLPELVFESTVNALAHDGAMYGKDYILTLATQSEPTDVVYCKDTNTPLYVKN